MTTRIRYKKAEYKADTLVSKGNFLLPDGQLIYVELNTLTNTYQFWATVDQSDTDYDKTISEGSAKNLLALKKLVRSTLIELGVPLEKEVKTWKKAEVAA